MNYRLKNKNGNVAFLMRTGRDFVRSQMPIVSAQHIVNDGKLFKSDVEGYPININNKWYFEGEVVKVSRTKKKEDM